MVALTETENPDTTAIDTVSTLEAVEMINREDEKVAAAVRKVLPAIAEAIDRVTERLNNGGRLFYVGTGTSGRLGVLDASEIPPTFGVSYELVQGVIAGGPEALFRATEASEDDREMGAADLCEHGVTKHDAVIGIAASGRTPYTIGAVEYARSIGAFTACIVCTPDSELEKVVELAIRPLPGPEAITGSTRMKAGTAQKMVLNMISTVSMIRLGYVKGNRMTNLRPSNRKLRERALRILAKETGLDEEHAQRLLDAANSDVRAAIVMHRSGAAYAEAEEALIEASFVVDKAVKKLGN